MAVLQVRPAVAPSGCCVGAVPIADNSIRLRTFLAFYDVELDFIAFFKRFVSIQLYRRVMDEYIRPVITSDESVALGVVEPLNLSFVLSHRLLPSFGVEVFGVEGEKGTFPPISTKTTKFLRGFSRNPGGNFIKWYVLDLWCAVPGRQAEERERHLIKV
jgi:hypothetical protein